jgi:hypothetical protein
MTQEEPFAGFDEFIKPETARDRAAKKVVPPPLPPPVEPPIIQPVPQDRSSVQIVRHEHRFRPDNVFACTLASAAAIIVVFVLLGLATLALGLLPVLHQ